MADAAQEFLNKQLSKNRFTANQQQRLENSGGASVAGYGNGVVPRGDAYAKYGKLPEGDTKTAGDYASIGRGESGTDVIPYNPDDELNVSIMPVKPGAGNSGTGEKPDFTKPADGAASGGGGDKYRGFDADSDSGRNYSTGAWGKGELDAAGLASKYNLDTSQEGRGDGHIWGRNADGSEVYIGKSSMDLASNTDLIASHSGQANSLEENHSSSGESLSSSGDIKGAILAQWKGGDAEVKAPEEEKERTPIEHSEEIKQATKRVRAYEDNIMSGKTSSDIFGDTYGDTGLSLNQTETNTNRGNEGIGTSTGAEPVSSTAAASFLDSKKTDTKMNYNFKPKADYTYGAN